MWKGEGFFEVSFLICREVGLGVLTPWVINFLARLSGKYSGC